jgi:Fur family zinc uptake transcriptional regulator
MKKAVAAIAENRQFSPSHQMVEIVGRCEHCRSAGS